MSGKSATADWVIAGLAAGQHGVVSFAQLVRAGIGDDAIRRRVEAGRLHRVHRGVYAVGHTALAREAMWMAAILACGTGSGRTASGTAGQPAGEAPVADIAEARLESVLEHWGAAVSHRSAAELLGLLEPAGGRICVSVYGDGGRRKRRGLHVHRSRTLAPEAVTSQRGIPVTTAARTIADLRRARRTRGCPATVARWELRRAIRQAEVLGLPTGAEHLTERSRSDLEQAFLRLCRRHGVPEPTVNPWIGSIQVDFLWPDIRLIAETDGYQYHRGRAAFENDRDRDLRLRALGYQVIRLSERQVAEEPRRVAEVLLASMCDE